jgi:hypothetical protein
MKPFFSVGGALGSVVGGVGGGVGGGAGGGAGLSSETVVAGSVAAGSTGSFFLNQFKGLKENPPACFLVPTLPLRLRLPLRVTLDLCLAMITMNNYILNEDINI